MAVTTIVRYQISYLGQNGLRVLFGAAQGHRMRVTRVEAEDELAVLLADPSNERRLRDVCGAQALGTFRVDPFDCWPNGDPTGIYVAY